MPASNGAAMLVPPTAVQWSSGGFGPNGVGVVERLADAGVGRDVGHLATRRARRVRRERLPTRPLEVVRQATAARVAAAGRAGVADGALALVPHRLHARLQERGAADAGDERIVGGIVDLQRLARRCRRAVVAVFRPGVAGRREHALALRGRLLEQRVQRVDHGLAPEVGLGCRAPARTCPNSSRPPARDCR